MICSKEFAMTGRKRERPSMLWGNDIFMKNMILFLGKF
jgi:hypothetical protein